VGETCRPLALHGDAKAEAEGREGALKTPPFVKQRTPLTFGHAVQANVRYQVVRELEGRLSDAAKLRRAH
jgi:hypothetical protein